MQPARGSATAYSQRCRSLRRQRGGRGVWSTALPNRRKEYEGAEAGLHLWVEAANKQVAAQLAPGSDTVKEEALNFAEMQFEELRELASARGLTEEDSVNIQWP
jgi:hypothetical protein